MSRPDRATPPAGWRRHRARLRRWLAAGLAAGAAAAGLLVLAPKPPTRVPVVVAAHDLAAGATISAADVVVARWSRGAGPDRVVTEPATVVGRVAAGPVARGTPVTEADLLGPGLLVGQDDGRLAVPVRLADPAAAALARRGDRVDLFAATGAGVVVADVVVLAEPGSGAGVGDGASLDAPVGSVPVGSVVGSVPGGAVVIVAVTSSEAAELARAQAAGPLTLAVHAR